VAAHGFKYYTFTIVLWTFNKHCDFQAPVVQKSCDEAIRGMQIHPKMSESFKIPYLKSGHL